MQSTFITRFIFGFTAIFFSLTVLSDSGSFNDIEKRQSEINALVQEISQSPEARAFLLNKRLIKLKMTALEKEISFANDHLEQAQREPTLKQQLITLLTTHREKVITIHDQLAKEIKLPVGEMSIHDEIALYNQIFTMKKYIDHIYHLYLDSITVGKSLGIHNSEDEEKLIMMINNVAMTNAILLELNMQSSSNLQATLQSLPEDSEVKSRLSLTNQRIQNLAESLKDTIDLMKPLHIPSSSYQELVIIASGQLSTDILDSTVVHRLLKEWYKKLMALLINDGADILLKFLLFCLIILAAKKASTISETLLDTAIRRSNAQFSQLLHRMLVSMCTKGIFILGVLIALSQIGISLAPLLAGLGVAGFIVGFAMQDTLSNFASGMMILIYRPFDEGDMIEAGGTYGCVHHMNLVSTTILTLDNQTIVVPNNKIWGDVIKNFTHQNIRRVDLMFGVAYSADIVKVEKILADIIEHDPRVLEQPEALIKVHELADSSVNMILRPWTATENYWDLHWDLIRTVKLRFDEEGIVIPFPQRDLHFNSDRPINVNIQNSETGC